MSVPLLDRDSNFEIYQIINLPIPYPRADQKLGAVARFRLEVEYIALNLARTKFMILPEKEASEYKTDALGACTSTNPIYRMSNHKLYVLELFKGDKRGRRNCQVEILTDVVLPQVVGVSGGVWAVVAQREIEKNHENYKDNPPINNDRVAIGLFHIWSVSVSSASLSSQEKIWEKKGFYQTHHHNHIVLAARISLTLSRHSSLSFIALGRSSGQQPVSSHSCWMYVRAGRPAFARPCVGIHKSTSLMSSSLLLQQCPACLVRLTWIVFMIGGRWPYSWCLVGCCCQDLFRIARSILV